MTDQEPLSAKQLAIQLGTDARTTRKFLRDTQGLVGQGHRWAIDPDPENLKKLKKRFTKWQTRQKPPVVKVEEPAEEPDFEELPEIDDLDLDLEDED